MVNRRKSIDIRAGYVIADRWIIAISMPTYQIGRKKYAFLIFLGFVLIIVQMTFVSTFSRATGSGGFPLVLGYGMGGLSVFASAILAAP